MNNNFWIERVQNIAHCIATETAQGASIYSTPAKTNANLLNGVSNEKDAESVYQLASYYYNKLDMLTDSVGTVLEQLLKALEVLLDEYIQMHEDED